MSAIRQVEKKDRRINGPVAPVKPAPKDEQPPRVRPRWNIIERQDYEIEITELKHKIEELESKVMEQEKSLVITQYGDKRSLETVKERVGLVPYAANLDERGRAMVAQICWMLDWNPFFDMHAFKSGGKLVLMPDYKKLMSMAKEQQRINHDSRPMTEQEQQEVGLKDGQVGYVTEVKEIDTFLEFAKAGVADQYSPVVGYGIYSYAHKNKDGKQVQSDNVPNTWTPEMVAKKRSIRNALYQLTNYKIVTKRFRDALMQIGAVAVGETDDGFQVDIPDQLPEGEPASANHFWEDPKQRQRFWISAKVISKKKSEIATALGFKIEDPEDSAQWAEHMAQFPDLENAIAYVNVVAENVKQEAPETGQESDSPVIIDAETGEVIKSDPAVTKCEKCKEHDATGEDPFPKLCALCAKKAADAEAAKES